MSSLSSLASILLTCGNEEKLEKFGGEGKWEEMRKEGGDLELEWWRKGKEKGCSRVWETKRGRWGKEMTEKWVLGL